jgi:TRAP-type C4-dicarboxylate transport system permease small subunit
MPYVLENKKTIICITIIVCFLTAIFAGLTVWSIEGTITTTSGSDGFAQNPAPPTTTVTTIDPVVQGMFAFLTIGFLFISIVLLMLLQSTWHKSN